MMRRELLNPLRAAAEKLQSAAATVQSLADSLNAPILYQSTGDHRGFRYGKPDARHFCLLKAVRAVSGMNACIQLTLGGYSQEIAVIVRTVVECTSHIEFVLLAANSSGVLAPGQQAQYVKKFFEDFGRGEAAMDGVKPRVAQKDIHQRVGQWLDSTSRELGRELAGSPTAEMMWRVYEVNSNYVHARYPEVMDLYGGDPGHFHLNGMSGTPKDDENCAIVEAYTETVALCVRRVARQFGVPLRAGE